MRLAARDLRAVGLHLHGRPDLTMIASNVFAVADSLQAHGSAAEPVLQPETIDPHAAIAEAVLAASSALAPSKRNWRLPTPSQTCLWADSRALRHILGHVLADAVRATREGDWIDIALQRGPAGLTLQIKDEGEGLLIPGGCAPAPRDSRGISLRLALARQLMQAHGGTLDIDARPGVGSQISLVFPAARVRASTPALATPVQAHG